MDESGLPFKVEQLAESRSFLPGYRGAWFRSKIKKISLRKKEMMHALEFYDFPDEKVRWTKLYQKPIGGSKSKKLKRQIVVRPSFPPVYRESQMPDVNNITEEVVIVRDAWKVGDLVDWWTDNCYWSARLTEILGDGKAQVELPPPPVGEGSSYEVQCKDLRPTLEWSPDYGWTVPISERENSHCCARLIKPANPVNQGIERGDSLLKKPHEDDGLMPPPIKQNPLEEGSQKLMVRPVEEVSKNAQPGAGASVEYNASFSSRMSTSTLPPPEKLERHPKRPLSPTAAKETNLSFNVVDACIGKSSYSDSVSSSHIRDAIAEMLITDSGNESYENSGFSKKIRNDGNIPLNSSCSDTIEAAIIDYEELINRVKWIKHILHLGTRPSNTSRPLWKYLEHRSSSFHKKD